MGRRLVTPVPAPPAAGGNLSQCADIARGPSPVACFHLRVHVRLLLVTPPAAPFHLAPPPPHPPCTRYHHPPLSGARNAQVFRTAKGKQLPVYVDYRNGGTRMLTILRRYRGADRVRLLPCCFWLRAGGGLLGFPALRCRCPAIHLWPPSCPWLWGMLCASGPSGPRRGTRGGHRDVGGGRCDGR